MLQKIIKKVLLKFRQSVGEKVRISPWIISHTENAISSADYDCH